MKKKQITIRYKLTDKYLRTYNNTSWEHADWKETNGDGDLCTDQWLHCYSHPLVALFLNPIHANFPQPRLLQVEVDGKTRTDKGLKEGWTRMRKLQEIVDFASPTLEQRVRFAILCALEVYHEKYFVEWARKWLLGVDPTCAADAADAADAAYAAYAVYAAMQKKILDYGMELLKDTQHQQER